MEKRFPLQLDSYFYLETYVYPNPSFDKDKPVDSMNKTSVLIQRDGKKVYCTVTVELDTAVCKNYMYNYKVQNFGVFNVDESFPEETTKQLIKETGVTILIGAIRERLYSITSCGPFPPIFLAPVLLGDITFSN